jgi:HK97 gp10 family phage protein
VATVRTDANAAALDRFATAVKAGAQLAVARAAVILKAGIQQELSQPGSGRFYARRKGGGAVAKALNAGGDVGAVGKGVTKVHRASAPGEPPAPDTGTLKRSAFIESAGPNTVRVGVATEYAIPLEYGTPRMAPRPFMRPALDKANAALRGALGDALKAALKSSRP